MGDNTERKKLRRVTKSGWFIDNVLDRLMSVEEPPVRGSAADHRLKAKALVSTLFAEWYGPLLRYAFRDLRSMETAEDVVQEAFTELYRTLLGGKKVANPRGWTLCVVRRGIIDRRRLQQRHGGVLLPLAAAGGLTAEPVAAPPPGWQEERLTQWLSLLSGREEEVLLLRASGLKYRQIAGQLKISVNSVKTFLTRAIRKMRQSSGATGPQAAFEHYEDAVAKTLQ